MLVDLIRFRQGKALPEILTARPAAEEEAAYAQFCDRRKREHEKLLRRAAEDPDRPAPTPAQVLCVSSLNRVSLIRSASLADLQERVVANVQGLEKEGLCTKANNYQDLLNAVAQVCTLQCLSSELDHLPPP
jgi:hypothetical protein